VPEGWDSFSVQRDYRGVHYDVRVKRVGKGNAVQMVVDGEPVGGNLVPLPASGVLSRVVDVTLGI